MPLIYLDALFIDNDFELLLSDCNILFDNDLVSVTVVDYNVLLF